MRSKPAPLRSIRLLILDVDGVMTNGRLHYGPDGETQKIFHVRDGHGIKAVRAADVAVAVISGRRSTAVAVRCHELGIVEVHQGIDDKLTLLEPLAARLGLQARQCACIGDDLPDIPLMRGVGLAIAVADAHPDARAAAHRCTRLPGGTGAVREVCDWLVRARSLGARRN